MRKIILLVVATWLTGCAPNSFADYYQGKSLEQVQFDPALRTCAITQVQLLPPEGPDKAVADMFAKGYALIGQASWRGPGHAGPAQAQKQGQNVGACMVLWGANYSHTSEGVVSTPVFIGGGYGFGPRYYHGFHGPYFSSGFYYPGVWTTRTDYYSVDIYDYVGLFFARIQPDPAALSVMVGAPPLEYMRKADTRSGVLVTGVMEGGHAYEANIFPGDILISVNGTPCAMDTPTRLKPGVNEVKIYRDGKVLTKKISLPSV